jgi:hypothetical protein
MDVGEYAKSAVLLKEVRKLTLEQAFTYRLSSCQGSPWPVGQMEETQKKEADLQRVNRPKMSPQVGYLCKHQPVDRPKSRSPSEEELVILRDELRMDSCHFMPDRKRCTSIIVNRRRLQL